MGNYQIKAVTIEWIYTPADYFEAPFSIEEKGYSIRIDDGKVTAKVEPRLYEGNNKITEDIQNQLNNIFLGVQVISHKPYTLSESKTNILKVDGGKIINLNANIACHVTVSDHVDIIVTDSKGNIVSDSRQERIEKKREFARLASKYIGTNATVKALFHSYQASVLDPKNELIHLYEIRETIKKPFKKENTTKQRLKITNERWKHLGDLANNEPLKQGRHRGQNPGELRDATPTELSEARDIAREMIYAYLLYLENDSKNQQ